ncbi:ANTAR domain-containing protein [Streptomyces sp. NPDC046931]|uniref:ANTAR domain-containing protein n=1 Tax=Streptomyces sp. NPDC046931 TaxID=3154806 RepID=UPI0033F7379B
MAFSAPSGRHPLERPSVTDLARDVRRLRTENERLQRALGADATQHQAVGVLAALGRIAPEAAWRVLRDVAQRSGTDLDDFAEGLVTFAQGGDLPDRQLGELRRALDRDATDSGVETSVRA